MKAEKTKSGAALALAASGATPAPHQEAEPSSQPPAYDQKSGHSAAQDPKQLKSVGATVRDDAVKVSAQNSHRERKRKWRDRWRDWRSSNDFASMLSGGSSSGNWNVQGVPLSYYVPSRGSKKS
jgi:hypothetical protein